jgi:hypothetical protein
MKRLISIALIGIILACATTGMQKKEDEAPLIYSIKASKDVIYKLTATKLMEYGFQLASSDPVLGRITTDYVDLEAGFGKSILAGMAGMKDFKASITTQIVESDSGYCDLILRGIGQYAEDKGLFKQDEINHQPVRKNTYTYKQMIKIADEIKLEAEK